METLKMFLDPMLLTVLVAAVAICFLFGEVNGEHSSRTPADPDANARETTKRK